MTLGFLVVSGQFVLASAKQEDSRAGARGLTVSGSCHAPCDCSFRRSLRPPDDREARLAALGLSGLVRAPLPPSV